MSNSELVWFKSSYSGGGGGDCLEVAFQPDAVRIRDSKDTSRTPLTVSPSAWTHFTTHVTHNR